MDKIREILENLCDEDDENVRCTMIDLALAEIKKVWSGMTEEVSEKLKDRLSIRSDIHPKCEAIYVLGVLEMVAELRQKLTQPLNESEVRR